MMLFPRISNALSLLQNSDYRYFYLFIYVYVYLEMVILCFLDSNFLELVCFPFMEDFFFIPFLCKGFSAVAFKDSESLTQYLSIQSPPHPTPPHPHYFILIKKKRIIAILSTQLNSFVYHCWYLPCLTFHLNSNKQQRLYHDL